MAGEIERPEGADFTYDPYNPFEIIELSKLLRLEANYRKQVATTMAIADELALSDAPGAVVITDHQTQGVGREGRTWHDKEGASILMSLMLRLTEPRHIREVADLTALETCLAIRQITGKDVELKYPNDIVFEDAKLGGILVRNVMDGQNRYSGTNIGIGINVHYRKEELAEYPTDYSATSLDEITGRKVRRQDVVMEILRRTRYIPEKTGIFETNQFEMQKRNEEWQEVSALLGRRVAVVGGDRAINGEVIDTKIGEGILLMGTDGKPEWHNIFDTNMKVRII